MLTVKDISTGQSYKIQRLTDVTHIVTRDGVQVTLYPNVIKLMVRKGAEFEGQTRMGTRKLKRLE